MKRLAWVVGLALLVVAGDALLCRALAHRDPLAALIGGRYFVGLLALAAAGVRLSMILLLPPWMLWEAILMGAAASRSKARSQPPS